MGRILFDRDEHRLIVGCSSLDDQLDKIARNARDLSELADTLESAGIPVRACHRSQLALVLLLDCLGRGDWQAARTHALILAELLPDFPPSLAVLFR
jgi:hypothetical protein